MKNFGSNLVWVIILIVAACVVVSVGQGFYHELRDAKAELAQARTDYDIICEHVGIEIDATTPDLVIDTDSGYDPNILLLDLDAYTNYADLMICWDGGEITMSIDGDKLEITGDTDKMNEAAKVFFDEMVKPMADAYIAERLHD